MPEFIKTAEDIYLLKTPFSTVWTGIVLITGQKNFLIDSGADEPEKYIIPALNKMGLDIKDISYLLNTHSHGDHIAGHFSLVNKYGLKTAVCKKGFDNLLNPAKNAIKIRTKFPKYSPPPQSWLKGVFADKVLDDGELLCERLKPLCSPGHDTDCVCWYDIKTKTIICGDSLQANGTPTQGIGFYQSLSDYKNTINRLLGEDIKNIICGHDYDGIGSVICGRENTKKALNLCLEYTNIYNDLIFKYVTEKNLTDPGEIAVKLINEVGCGMPENLFLALYTVTEHLKEIKKL